MKIVVYIACIFMLLFAAHSVFAVPSSANVNKDPFGSNVNMHHSMYILHYVDAAEIAQALNSNKYKILTAQEHLIVIKHLNALWIEAYADHLAAIRALLRRIDVPVKQIVISARIVSIADEYLHDIGLDVTTVNRSHIHDLTVDTLAGDTIGGKFNFFIAKLNKGGLLDLEISALASEGHAKIISSPKLTTLDRQAAVIESGDEIPYQEKTGQGNTSIAFKKAVLRLHVTPTIMLHNRILLQIKINQDKVSDLMVDGVPAINTREIETQALVGDQQTVVLGGIFETENTQKMQRIPVLSALPVMGALFRHKQTKSERKQLLIFISPRIV